MDCQHRIKFSHQIRVDIIDKFDVQATTQTIEVYELVNDGMELKCITTNASTPMITDDAEEQEELVEITEVDENFEVLEDEEDEEFNESAEAGDDALDAVSFLLDKKELFEDEKSPNKSRNGRRAHKCDVCEKSFMRKSNLVDHLRLHANLRLFKCEYCDKEFVQAGNYRSHLRVSGSILFHLISNKSILSATFFLFSVIIQVHTKERPYACSMCPKTYNQSSALKVHIRSHTNEKNYVCETCNKAFTNSSDLNKHKRVHDPNLKFKCDQCEHTFAQRVNLKNHIARHHLKEKEGGRKNKKKA